MNFLLVYIVKIQFTRNTIPNAITPYTIKPRNIFLICFKKKYVQPQNGYLGFWQTNLDFMVFSSSKYCKSQTAPRRRR